MAEEYEHINFWDKKCEPKYGGIKAVLIQRMKDFPKNYSDEKHISQAEPFLQIGDAMTSKNQDRIEFGNDTIYIKLIDDQEPCLTQ